MNELNTDFTKKLASINEITNAWNYWVFETDRRQREYDGTPKRRGNLRASRRNSRDIARNERDRLFGILSGLVSERNDIQSQIDSQNSLIDELTKSLLV